MWISAKVYWETLEGHMHSQRVAIMLVLYDEKYEYIIAGFWYSFSHLRARKITK